MLHLEAEKAPYLSEIQDADEEPITQVDLLMASGEAAPSNPVPDGLSDALLWPEGQATPALHSEIATLVCKLLHRASRLDVAAFHGLSGRVSDSCAETLCFSMLSSVEGRESFPFQLVVAFHDLSGRISDMCARIKRRSG